MTIPFVDLGKQHAAIADDLRSALDRVMLQSAFILGPDVAAFEEEFAAFCGRKHAVAVANGTDAIELGLRALGIGRDDEVIVPANTYVATAAAVARVGARPVFADCDDEALLLDPASVEKRLTLRTRAIVPVHLYGQMAPVEEIAQVTGVATLARLEDAAQAHGALRQGRAPGSWGQVATFSFYPSKNLGAYGDAGAVVTDDAAAADRVRALRTFGSPTKNHHPTLGFNSRTDTLQAAILRAKLPHLRAWNEERRAIASRYDELFTHVPQARVVRTLPGNSHVFHLYVVRIPRRDEVLHALGAAGIGAAVHYPTPLHLLGAFRECDGGPGSCPNAEKAAGEILSLPMFPGLAAGDQERVVTEIARALHH